jgi:glycosyltransferase involved in cell wall biosynthesis
MRQIAERMVLAGHEVTVATSYLRERDFSSHNGVAIREFKVEGNAVRGMVGELERYRDFVLGFGGDAILIKAAQQWTFDALWPVLDQIKVRKVLIPCGFSEFYEPECQQYFAKLPQILAKFDHLIFYAEKYRDIDFARAHGLTNISVLPNGASETEFGAVADPEFRARLGISTADFVFLTVGAPIATKGHREIAEAFDLLETAGRPATLVLNSNWEAWNRDFPRPPRWSEATKQWRGRIASDEQLRLVLYALELLLERGWRGLLAGVQRGLRRPRLERRQKRSARGVSQAGGERWRTLSEIIGHVQQQPHKRILRTNFSRSDLIQAYMTADLFVFASNVEYSPLVLFETLAAGTPFLSVPVGNAEEIARWTQGGIIAPAARDKRGYTRADPSVLAQEMERCVANLDLLVQLGRVGNQSWRNQFTWAKIAPRYEEILSGRLAEKSSHLFPHNLHAMPNVG